MAGKRRVPDVMIEVLRGAGVERCYGIVGDTLNHFTDALRRDGKIAWVHVRHEEVGGFAAGGESYITGRLSACAGSCGPGSVHFLNGLMESNRNRAPVLFIGTTNSSAENGVGFIQDVDLPALYRQTSVFCEVLTNPDETRRMLTLAAQAALTKRGVAVLIVPGDVMTADATDTLQYAVHVPAPVIRPNHVELDRIAELIGQGKNITVYGGSGCQHAHDQVVQLCRKIKAPLVYTSRAKDFLEPDNPVAIGMTGIFGAKSGFHAVMNCDTLVLLGCDFAWRQFYPHAAKVIQIDIDPAHLGRRHPVDIGVGGDVRDTLDALLPLIEESEDDSFLKSALEEHKHALKDLVHQEQPGRNGLLHPQQVAHLLDAHADEDAIFTADAGTPLLWMVRHIKSNGRRRTLSSLWHGTMANAMPQALGIKKAFPDRQVIALCGDGGLTMLMGDLLTLVQEDVAVKIVIFNNRSLGIVELEMKTEGLLDAYVELDNPDFSKVAEACRMGGWRVEHNQDLEAAIREFLAHPGPAILDVAVNPLELTVPPKVEFGEVVGTAIYAAKAVLSGRGAEVMELIGTNYLAR